MNIFSLNIRGTGDRAKRRRLRDLMSKGKVTCCFLQETKCSNLNRNVVSSLWYGGDFNFVAKNVEWLPRGMLIIWDVDVLEASFSFSRIGSVGVYAKKKNFFEVYFLVNVYAPCSWDSKKEC